MPAKRALIMHPHGQCRHRRGRDPGGRGGRRSRWSGALRPLRRGGDPLRVQSRPAGHSARRDHPESTGRPSAGQRAIAKGALVHIHNLEGTRARGDLERGESHELSWATSDPTARSARATTCSSSRRGSSPSRSATSSPAPRPSSPWTTARDARPMTGSRSPAS